MSNASGTVGRRRVLAGVLAVASGLAYRAPAGAGPVTTDQIGDRVQTVAKGELPDFAKADSDVSRLYRYAVENGDELRYIPCTCGCGRFGHTSNRECYIKAVHADGSLTFTSHAAT